MGFFLVTGPEHLLQITTSNYVVQGRRLQTLCAIAVIFKWRDIMWTAMVLWSGDIDTPISQHNHVNRKKKAPCLGCKGIRIGEIRSRSQPLQEISGNCARGAMTLYGCDKCDVAICTRKNCSDFYQTIFLGKRCTRRVD